jgi:hypothetical protein
MGNVWGTLRFDGALLRRVADVLKASYEHIVCLDLRLQLAPAPLRGGRGVCTGPDFRKEKRKNKSNGKTFLFLLSLSRRQKINT